MTTAPAPAPRTLSIKLTQETADLLHRLAYETGRSKLELVSSAVVEQYRDR